MKKTKKGRVLTLFLTLLMVLSMVPMQAFAANFGDQVNIKRDHWAAGIEYNFNGYKSQLNLPHNAYGQLAVLRTASGDYTYCIQLGDKVAGSWEEIAKEYGNLSEWQQNHIKYSLVYGFNGATRYGYSADEEYAGTQAVIWAICYDDFNNSREELFLERMFAGSTSSAKANARDVFYKIKEQILTHETRPAFNCADNTVTLGYNTDTGKYSATIWDSNGVLAYYNVRDNQGLTFSKNGNALTITANSYSDQTKTIIFDRTSNTYCSSLPSITLGFIEDDGQVNVVGVNVFDPIYASLKVKIQGLGSAKIIKQSEDGVVAGLQFRITGNGIDEVVTTGEDGTIVKGSLTPGKYTITEINTPDKFVQPESQTVTVTPNQTAIANFSNILKKFKAELTKQDAETGAAQGNATLEGAVYGLYNGEDLVESLTTDKNGKAVSGVYPCGDNWTIREIKAPEGYLLDETVYKVGAEPKNFTVESNTLSASVKETPIKGKISLVKYKNDNLESIKTPEADAEFEIYLKSAGSYEKAKDSERDILKTDADGNAHTKDLPYGIYTVHQTKGSEGFYFVDDFDVTISANGKTYQYILNNELITSKIKIVKKDAETHKVIPVANVAFKIRDVATGEFITQHVNYPSDMDMDVFYTDKSGSVTLPQPLGWGEYELIEVSAPNGYILDGTPVLFKADGSVITVVKEDSPQKGKITITKVGEVFSSVQEENGMFTPEYSLQGLQGTVFEVKAAEDIYTPDGTLRVKQGQLVDTVTTNKNGVAITKSLYLGKYAVTEKSVTNGFILDQTVYGVELKYAGETVSAAAANVTITNERQKVNIDLTKKMEEDILFDIGMHLEILKVRFGLYAAEDITAKDGTKIPTDGLIEIVSVDKDGHAQFAADLPFGKYYVQEYATDEHYILSNEKYEVVFEYGGPNEYIVDISVNEGKVIPNEIIRGSVIGKKVDDDGFEVCGALMGLFRANETVFTEETALMTSVSNEIGVFGFEDIPYGIWLVREIESSKGFVLNDLPYLVNINEQGAVIEIEVEDKIITGSVRVTKVDEEYPNNKLSGAEFEVFVDVDNNKEFDPKIDLYVDDLEEIEEGIYQLDELRYNGYFVHEKTAPEGFLQDDNYYYFAIEEEGAVVDVENKAGVGFINKPIVGELEITKTDITDGKPLANAGFRVRNAETGEIVAEGYTDENGVAKFPLRYGKYTYQEFDAPNGYEIDEREFPFEIRDNGEIVKAEMTNTPIPTPKTGNTTPIGLYVLILGGSVLAVSGLGFGYMKRRKKEAE